MNDLELAAAVQAIFDANDPADGIDRSDGLGEDYTVRSVRVVGSDDGFDDLEVTVAAGAETVVARLLFDRAWREASGLDDPASYAAYVVARWRSAREDQPERTTQTDPVGYDELEAALGRTSASLSRTRTGVLEVVDEDGEVYTLHATPHEWQQFAAGRRDPIGDLDERVTSRWDDEEHIVFFRGDFHRSIRAELPPVRSMLLREDAGG